MQYIGEFCNEGTMEKNGFQMSLINHWGELGGFKALIGLIKTRPDYKCPIPLMRQVLHTFFKLEDVGVRPDFAMSLLSDVVTIVSKRLSVDELPPEELKEVSLDSLKMLIKFLCIYMTRVDKKVDRFREQETLELSLAKRYLTCPFFELRIKGMKEFNLIHEKIINKLNVNKTAEMAVWLDL